MGFICFHLFLLVCCSFDTFNIKADYILQKQALKFLTILVWCLSNFELLLESSKTDKSNESFACSLTCSFGMMKKTAAFAKIEELLQTNQRWHFNFISNPHVFSELLCENRSWCLLVQCFVSLFFFALILTVKLPIHFVTHLVIF